MKYYCGDYANQTITITSTDHVRWIKITSLSTNTATATVSLETGKIGDKTTTNRTLRAGDVMVIPDPDINIPTSEVTFIEHCVITIPAANCTLQIDRI
jgi:hypothetical protein